MDATEQLLKELSDAKGVSGHETEVRAIVRRRLELLEGSIVDQDRIGSVVCRLGDSGPRVMLAAHMDEIGFMVNHITDQGFLKFIRLGGWWSHVLLGQRVIVQTRGGDLPGVIGAKPPHLLQDEERAKLMDIRDMYIDIGAASKTEVEDAGVRIGDPVVPDSRFRAVRDGAVYMGKAFDDRAGVALMVQAMERFAAAPHPNILYGVGTVMEEVGVRGAKTSADMVSPDAAIVLEADVCGDLPGIRPEDSSIKLGGGPSLILMEARLISNLKFRDLAIETAKELAIPLQLSIAYVGSTDGGQIHLQGIGVPTIVLAVPARHIHSHAGFIHRGDYDDTLRLLAAIIEKLDRETVNGFIR